MNAIQDEVQNEASLPDQGAGPAVNREGDRETDRVVMLGSALGATAVPNRILIAPWGEVRSSSGSFIVDEAAATAAIAAFEAHETDLPVDFEHQTLGGAYSSPSGQAPAAGWIKALSVVSPAEASQDDSGLRPGLWAEVEWTAEALEKLRTRQYRYLSPVALVRRSDRRLVGIHSVALTNKPAIVGMQPVVNGAGATETVEKIPTSDTVELRDLLAIDDAASEAVVLVAAAERIRSLAQAEKLREASERVSRAMSAGKLTVGQSDWALSLAEHDPASFDAWEASAPPVVPLGRLSAPIDRAGEAPARRRGVEESARAEWRANRVFLEKLCTEEAYAASALREFSE